MGIAIAMGMVWYDCGVFAAKMVHFRFDCEWVLWCSKSRKELKRLRVCNSSRVLGARYKFEVIIIIFEKAVAEAEFEAFTTTGWDRG